MTETGAGTRSQRGIALVVAMLVLLFISLLATAMITSISVDNKLAGQTGRVDRALNTAEAGVAEAMERIRVGDVPNSLNPKMVSQIFLTPAGTVPSVGSDTTALATEQQDTKNWLAYSTPKRSSEVLTVTYKTDAARTKIYRYDATKNPAIQTGTGAPIFVITATGHVNDSKRTVVTEVIQVGMRPLLKAAVVAKKNIKVNSGCSICGYNHRIDTPTWTNSPNGRDKSAQSCNVKLSEQKWELGSGDLPGAWSAAKIGDTKKADLWGVPAGYQQNQSGFYGGAWDVFGMSQSDYYAWLGAPITNVTKLKGNIDGVRYYKVMSKSMKKLGTLEINGADGEGYLYVEAKELRIKGQFTYTGLIYCTGKIKVNAKTWVLGGMIAGDEANFDVKKSTKPLEAQVLYSEDAIISSLNKYNGPFVTLSWREKP